MNTEWTDAKLRGIASDYFHDEKDWPAAMNCLRHLLMEQAKKRDVLSVVVNWALAGHISEKGVTCEAGDAIRAAVAEECAASRIRAAASMAWE